MASGQPARKVIKFASSWASTAKPPASTIALYLSAFAPNEELVFSMRCVAV